MDGTTDGLQDMGWQLVESRRQRQQQHVWLKLRQGLVQTLDELYSMCEDEPSMADSAVRYLEHTLHHFKQVAGNNRTCSNGSHHSNPDQPGSQQQHSVPHRLEFQSGPCGAQPNNVQQTEVGCCDSHCSQGDTGTGAVASAGAASSPAPAARRSSCSRLSRSSSSHAVSATAAGSMHTAVTQYDEQECCDADDDSEAGSADIFSSCSTSSSASDLSSVDGSSGSKGSTGSSASSGAAWRGAMNWSAVFEARSTRASNTQQSAGPMPCLHHKLSSPDRLRRPSSRATTEQRQRRAEQLRAAMAEERLARLKQEQAAKQQRRAAGKEEEGAANAARADKHQRSELLRAAHIRRIKAKAGDETRKVEEVSFINALNNEGRKADLQQRLEEGEARRAEALAAILAKQAGAAASVKEAAERRRAAEAERLAQLADKRRRKQQAQAKMEQERLAAAAAREAAKAAGAQQREAARQQQAAWLSSKISARLKEAAQRRIQHLELIRERAALGKDFERRDSFTAASLATRCPSPALRPAASSSAAGGVAGKAAGSSGGLSSQLHTRSLQVQQLTAKQRTALPRASSAPDGSSTSSSSCCASVATSKLNAAAPSFCPAAGGGAAAASGPVCRSGRFKALQVIPGDADTRCSSSSSSSLPAPTAAAAVTAAPNICRPVTPTGGSGSSSSSKLACAAGGRPQAAPSPPASPAAAAAPPLPAEVLAQLQGHSQSIEEAGFTPGRCLRASIKGARRRMAKARRMLLQPGSGLQGEPADVALLSCSPEAQQLLASWAPYLALVDLQPYSCATRSSWQAMPALQQHQRLHRGRRNSSSSN
ncbi:hypothetical protein COO60DRAFT_379382 [Scenedesmus sp. NREL 46B-D3]|nr:hypothetical protein COO60DRAFT_379382 [Scenedesmus sp. NREL 46B-D3]